MGENCAVLCPLSIHQISDAHVPGLQFCLFDVLQLDFWDVNIDLFENKLRLSVPYM